MPGAIHQLIEPREIKNIHVIFMIQYVLSMSGQTKTGACRVSYTSGSDNLAPA